MRYLFYTMLVTYVLLSVGCITQFANRSDVVILDERSKNLDNRISKIENQISKIEGEAKEAMQAVEEVGRPALTGQAYLHARLDAIQADIDELHGRLEELSHDIAALRLTGIESRMARIETFLGFEVQKLAPQAEISGEALEEKVEEQDPEALYQEAYKLYEDGSFVQSREKFKEYLHLFPDTDKSDNAQFWIGECYYSQKRYEEAILEYEKVIRGYPKSNKVPSALLKQGIAFYELGDKTSSELLLEKVIKDYSHTNEAKIASRRLERIR